jgi:hypothetical protein
MDGISEDQLWIERMNDYELSEIHLEYLNESVASGFWRGKSESYHWKITQMLGREIRIRMSAI